MAFELYFNTVFGFVFVCMNVFLSSSVCMSHAIIVTLIIAAIVSNGLGPVLIV